MPEAKIGDMSLQYVDQGTGRTLLLVHGFPLDHSMWTHQIAALSGRCRVVVPDLRGFGRSGVTPGTVSMEQFADDLAALLDHLRLSEPVVFCGLSMGGYIGWQFWKRYPQRLAALILSDTRAAADSPEAARGRLVAAEQVVDQGPDGFVATMLPKLFAEETSRTQRALVDATRQVMLNTSRHGIAAALRGMAIRADMTGELPQVDVPALVLCGEHDVITPPAEMRGIASVLPQAQFVEIPRAGHMAPAEQPGPVNGALEKLLDSL